MERVAGTVHYEDGRSEDFSAGTAIHRKWEAFAMRHGYPTTPDPQHLDRFPVYTWRLYLAWAALGVEEGFDVWAETVAEVAEAETPETVDPTPPGASPGA
jgi:hypothetical protein